MTPFIEMLPKILKWSEIASLVVTLAAIVLKVGDLEGANQILMVGLFSLAVTYFLSAYTNVEFSGSPEKQRGFADLLMTIVRKVMYIGLSVFCVALTFSFLHLAGANQQMMVGVIAVGGGSAISMFLILANRDRMAILQAPLYRCVVALAIFFLLPYLTLS